MGHHLTAFEWLIFIMLCFLVYYAPSMYKKDTTVEKEHPKDRSASSMHRVRDIKKHSK